MKRMSMLYRLAMTEGIAVLPAPTSGEGAMVRKPNPTRPSIIKRRGLIWQWCCALLLALTVFSACATGPQLTDHAFEFDARADSKDAEVLDYRYGDYPMTRTPNYRSADGKIRQSLNVNGFFPRGNSLYVKWRIKSTGEAHEDTVDLRQRLPAEITRHRIYFVINGPQLHLYLISPEKVSGLCPEDMAKAAKTMPSSDRVFRLYCDHKIIAIYPDQSKF